MSGNVESDKLLYCADINQWWLLPPSAKVKREERGRYLVVPEEVANIIASIQLEVIRKLMLGVDDSQLSFLLVTANKENNLPTTGVVITSDMIIEGLR